MDTACNDDQSAADRVAHLEAILREIANFTDKHPEDDRLHVVRVLAKVGLGPPLR
jgi:hypothetical protein